MPYVDDVRHLEFSVGAGVEVSGEAGIEAGGEAGIGAGGETGGEVSVELVRPCPRTGRVAASKLPAGRAVTTVHRGPSAAWPRPTARCSTGVPPTTRTRPTPVGRATARTSPIAHRGPLAAALSRLG
jgi:hypothetical protein